MTTITQDINDLAGVDDNTSWTFYTEQIRLSSTGTAVVSTKKVRKYPVAGVLTVVLDPGPAVVVAPDGKKYPFTVPGSDSDLWTLIAGAIGMPPGTTQQAIAAAVADYLNAHQIDEYHEYANLAAFPSTGLLDRLYLAQNTNFLYRWSGSAYIQVGGGASSEWEEYASLAAFPGTGDTAKEYVALDTGKIYRWNGSAYIEVSVGEPTITAGTTAQYWRGDKTFQTLNQDAVAPVAHSLGSLGSTYTLSAANATGVAFAVLTANTVITLPTPVAGGQFTLVLKQDATGGWTPTFGGATVDYPAGSPNWITTANALNIVEFRAWDTSAWHVFPATSSVDDITGNAATATKLLTARNINGIPFDGTASVTIPAGSTLTATAVKTSAYTAASGDLIPADATSAGFTITLPAAPTGTAGAAPQIVIKKVDATANSVTVAAGGSDKFNTTSGATSFGMALQNQAVHLQYMSSSGIWYVISTDVPLSGLDARYTPTAALTTKGDMYAATAASTPARVAVGPDGYVLTANSAAASGVSYAAPTNSTAVNNGDGTGTFTPGPTGSVTNNNDGTGTLS